MTGISQKYGHMQNISLKERPIISEIWAPKCLCPVLNTSYTQTDHNVNTCLNLARTLTIGYHILLTFHEFEEVLSDLHVGFIVT
jgi:hypothetical protein